MYGTIPADKGKMYMKRKIIIAALAILAVASMISCAKRGTGTSGNDSTKRYLDAWIARQKQIHTEYMWEKTPLGSYILESSGGNGSATGNSDLVPFVKAHITMYSLDGDVESSSTEFWAKRLGYYAESDSYDPIILRRGAGSMAPGIDEIISMISNGQKVKLLIPGWLMADDNQYPRYNTAEEYYSKCSGTSSIIEIELKEGIPDLEQYQLHQITTFLNTKYGAHISEGDSAGMHGFYYFQLKAPTDTADIKTAVSGKINYTGMLTNSKVFDTTNEDLAKERYVYDASRTYGPVQVTWAEKYEDITMGSGESSSLITGFKFALSKLHEGEKGVAVFTSDLGYGNNITNSSIPAYSPLAFELEVVSVDK